MLKFLNNKLDLIFKKLKYLSVFFLRLGLGFAFTIHGVNKFPLPPEKLIEYFGFSPFLASFVAISEVAAGITLILGGFLKNYIGNFLTRFSALVIIIIMFFAFYFAHKDWFITTKLFTSEQIFLFLIGFYFLSNGNGR
tara:strand:- start:29 stop:442 length:414 start_codon:yes stop_codon:yes gene_type:complete